MREWDCIKCHTISADVAALKGKCKRGDEIKCGDKIRLMHLTTKCLLHSHMFNAPLSRSNQVYLRNTLLF